MLFKLVSLVHLCAAFPLKCPEPAQWRIRANGHCADPSKYFCLRNDLINGYSENCTRSDFLQAGRKSVLRGGIDAEVCSKDRYQPYGYIFYTNASTNCILYKSFCNEEGQVEYDPGGRNTDATCRCDYRRGYDFLKKTNNPCFCKPSQEDCSCFLKICSNSSHMLSPDYKCTIKSDLPPVTHCRAITYEKRKPDVKDTFQKEDTFSVLFLHAEVPWKKRSAIYVAILSISSGTLVLFILVVCIGQLWRYCFKSLEINGPEPELNLIEGDTLTLQYMLPIKRLRLCFFKDDMLIAVNVKTNVFQKNNVTLGDEGNYFAKVCNIRSRITKVTVQSMFTSEINQINCIEGGNLLLKCSVYSEHMCVEWFKNDKKIYQNSNISIMSDGKDHCMTVKHADLSDAGQYIIVAGNVRKQITVAVKVLPEAINRLQEKDRTRYIELMQSSEMEKRYFARIMIVGKESVGKTCLVRRLLMKNIDGVSSTDGVDIVVNKCKINIDDGSWLIDGISDDKTDRISRAFKSVTYESIEKEQFGTSRSKASTNSLEHVKGLANSQNNINNTNLYRSELSTKMDDKMNANLTDEGNNSCIDIRPRYMSPNVGTLIDNESLTSKDTDDNLTENENSNKLLSLVMPRDLMSHVFSTTPASNIPSNHYALCSLWDFAGQKEFYATHQAFLTNSSIYLVVADMKDEISKQDVSQYSADFQNVGEYVDFWFDTIHCHRTVEPLVNEPLNDYIDPPVILVLTGKDKYEKETIRKNKVEERKTELQTQLGMVLGGQSKYHHLREIICLSNKTDPDVKFEELQKKISSIITNMAHWGQNMPLKWILLEHLIEINKNVGNNFINLSDMEKLANHSDINMIDIDNVKLFLRFQHEVGNIIYFEDIKDFIILNPKWLVDAFRCLVSDKIDDTLQHRTDWTKFEQNWTMSESLITELFKSKCGNKFSDQRENLVKVMEKFDILVKIPGSSSYLMPSQMPSVSFDDVCIHMGVEQPNCKRTSWMCLKFSFIPPAFFNHFAAWFIRQYKPSKLENSNLSVALFRGICVFDIDMSGCEKLLVTMSTDIMAIQLLSFSTKCKGICLYTFKDKLIKKTQAIIKRYKLTISYEIHFKCSKGRYFEDTVSYKDLKSFQEYHCKQHKCVHQSEDLYLPWIQKEEIAVRSIDEPKSIGECHDSGTQTLDHSKTQAEGATVDLIVEDDGSLQKFIDVRDACRNAILCKWTYLSENVDLIIMDKLYNGGFIEKDIYENTRVQPRRKAVYSILRSIVRRIDGLEMLNTLISILIENGYHYIAKQLKPNAPQNVFAGKNEYDVKTMTSYLEFYKRDIMNEFDVDDIDIFVENNVFTVDDHESIWEAANFENRGEKLFYEKISDIKYIKKGSFDCYVFCLGNSRKRSKIRKTLAMLLLQKKGIHTHTTVESRISST